MHIYRAELAEVMQGSEAQHTYKQTPMHHNITTHDSKAAYALCIVSILLTTASKH